MTVFLTGQASYLSGDASIQVQQEARRALDSMVRELREAVGDTVVVDNAQQLRFQVALGYNLIATMPTCPANDICPGAENIEGQQIRYRIVQGQLRRDVLAKGAGANDNPLSSRVLANQVDATAGNTSFAWNLAALTVTMRLQVITQNAQLTGGSRATGVLVSQVRLRNS